MSNIRLTHRATITRRGSTALDTDGERIVSDTTVYEDLPCLVRARTASSAETDLYSASVGMYQMYLPPGTALYPKDKVTALEYRNGESVFTQTDFEVVNFSMGTRYDMASLREVR